MLKGFKARKQSAKRITIKEENKVLSKFIKSRCVVHGFELEQSSSRGIDQDITQVQNRREATLPHHRVALLDCPKATKTKAF